MGRDGRLVAIIPSSLAQARFAKSRVAAIIRLRLDEEHGGPKAQLWDKQ
jgi:hypothetical protein